MPLLLNQLQAASVRRFTSWKGVWFADVDVVLDELGVVPKGPCILTLGTRAMVGTVDPRASGSFAKTAKVRVLAGGAGWDTMVLPLPFQNPVGVLSTEVYAATAAEVLETVVDVVPSVLGSKTYLRTAGPASRVFGDADWYVSPQGVTFVGPRVPIPFDPTTTEILAYDPLTRVAELATDVPIEPATVLLDPLRFDGPLIVRDVEQTWSSDGSSRAMCWCAEQKGSRLQGALSAYVKNAAGVAYLKTYLYRVVLQDPASEDLILQIVDPKSGAPNALPIEMWMGVPGVGAKMLLGSEVLVSFANGEPGRPCVVGFKHGDIPILLELGTGLGGPLALAVGTQAQIQALEFQVAALMAWVAAATAAMIANPAVYAAFATAMATPGTTVASAVAAQIPVIAAAVPFATSKLVVSD